MGNAAGALALNGGTLQVQNGDIVTSNRAISLGSAGGTVNLVFSTAFDTTTFTAGGVISGPGALTVSGAGEMILTANATYTGGTTVTGSGLQLGNNTSAGTITGNVTLNNTNLVFEAQLEPNVHGRHQRQRRRGAIRHWFAAAHRK